ncbi:glycerophosphodiester phosphodiesterase [Tumebacillus permanentifrigoris]|uniref:Glycerophosphoryl diester phosphodiesterase n=1 Tax=Tumebacillus permanentifrigoris TaxID=378543 RepID=A0A316DRL5_9BACL|nr:glycerophosphodiester phosphodiesterase [Tumebacillus permanentifrigoris]PWK07459.1 glycerophosphoryl diester phosphodiesterase [Tumebacillus permanentifrigoris]
MRLSKTKPYLDLPRPMVLAHQGASGHAPSNTREAFQLAVEMGADAFETDIHMTRDGHVVLSHDETVDRLTDGKGWIRDMTLAELKSIDFGYQFSTDGGRTYPFRGQGVTIPTLDEVLQEFPTIRVNMDIKQKTPPLELALVETIKRHDAQDRVLVTSFHSVTMQRFRRLGLRQVATSANTRNMVEFVAYWRCGMQKFYKPPVDAFQVPVSQYGIPVVTPRSVEIAHGHGVKVHVWTINEERQIRQLLEWGVDGICSDYPDRVVKVLREMELWDR